MQQNKADLLCGSVSETLTRRKDFGFSNSAIFPSGIGGVLRVDAPAALISVLAKLVHRAPIRSGAAILRGLLFRKRHSPL